ncbi:MAG: helix-turn-helix transcriptional regulator [Lentisphaeria bacterium]|nr:helix-turn-helix transcriptional regulator [Lentisphaeria bacterium]
MERTEIVLCTVLLDALGAAVPFASIPWTAPFLLPPHLRPRSALALSAGDIRQIGEEFRNREGELGARTSAANWLALHRLLLPFATGTTDGEGEGGDALERVKPALDLLRGGWREPVRIDEAAVACGLGKRRFCDLFRRAFGVSFGQFALRARLAGAGEDVRRRRQSLRAIAKNWGFYDISHLHRAFHRHYGCSPAEFRARAAVHESTPDGQ